MVHVEQILWPSDIRTVKLGNMLETELWIFKDRLYNNLCTVKEEPTGGYGKLYYTVFEDNANICYGVYTTGHPDFEWCHIREVRKLECGLKT